MMTFDTIALLDTFPKRTAYIVICNFIQFHIPFEVDHFITTGLFYILKYNIWRKFSESLGYVGLLAFFWKHTNFHPTSTKEIVIEKFDDESGHTTLYQYEDWIPVGALSETEQDNNKESYIQGAPTIALSRSNFIGPFTG